MGINCKKVWKNLEITDDFRKLFFVVAAHRDFMAGFKDEEVIGAIWLNLLDAVDIHHGGAVYADKLVWI